jgi:hypothetical protein
MLSVRARIVAFAPLVVLTLLTATAAVAGYRVGDGSPASAAAGEPSGPVQTTSPPDPSPYTPLPNIAPPLPTVAGASVGQARESWGHALDKLLDAGSGKYSWAVYLGADPKPLQSESGGFDLDPLQTSFDRTLAFGNGRTAVMHMRRIGTATYMQLDHWGSWTGCWLQITNEQLEQQTGVEFSASLPLPVGVLAITDSLITNPNGSWFGPPYREYSAEVSAAEALQFLGISGVVLKNQLTRLVEIEVPITISLDVDGRLHGGGARGSQVAAAIAKAAPNLLKKMVANLPELRAAFAVTGLGSQVSVPRPPPRSILPPDAGRNDTCAARGPRA